jgi:dTDP-4-dehydrorhamnose 3,5-epimerase
MTRTVPGRLSGLLLIEPDVHQDARGVLVETYRRRDLIDAGIDVEFVLEIQSRSERGVVRGLHFRAPPGQSKLVRVARGRIHAVAVDIRLQSATFGEHEAFELDDRRHGQLFVPAGFANGFAVLSDSADVCYRLSEYYDAASEQGIAWNDPRLGIAWPIEQPTVSDRDGSHPPLNETDPSLLRW